MSTIPSPLAEFQEFVATTASRSTLAPCKEEGVTDQEMMEMFAVGLAVGGSMVIPHLRAVGRLEERKPVCGEK